MELIKEILQDFLEPFNNTMNFIVCMVLTALIIFLTIECIKTLIGYDSTYERSIFVIGLIVLSLVTIIYVATGKLRLDYKPIILGAVITLTLKLIFFITINYLTKKEEIKYKNDRIFNIDRINKNNLRRLIQECEQSNIALANRRCNCQCKFGNIQKSVSCGISKNSGECFTLSECEGAFCSVFNTTVDFLTDCEWNDQDKFEDECSTKCLLSKINVNNELKELVENILNETI